MKSISVNYKLKWMFKEHPHIRVTTCKKVFNIKTGRLKKLSLNGGYSRGYWIGKSFITYNDLNKHIIKIPKYKYNFVNSKLSSILAKN